MNTYKVFFKIFDKKLQATVEAEDLYEARKEVENNLIVDEIRIVEGEEPQTSGDIPEELKGIFGGLKL